MPVDNTIQHQHTVLARPGPQSAARTNQNCFQKLHTKINDNKDTINTSFNLASAAANFLGFLNGNFNFVSLDEETVEKACNFFAKLGTASRGITGAADCWAKNNLIPLVGSTLEVPIALFTGGYDLWLARGLAQSIRQEQATIKRRGMKITKPDGKEITLSTKDGDDFTKYGIGMWDGFIYSIKELGKVFKEIFTTPFAKDGQRFGRAVTFCSVFQGGGPIIALLGLDKLGAFIRDLAGGLIDIAYMMDEKKPGRRSYFPAGLLWLGTAAIDFEKRVSLFSGNWNSLTQLSLALDPLAAIYESRANYDTGDEAKPQFSQAA